MNNKLKIDYLSDLHLDFYFSSGKKIKDDKIKEIYDPIFLKDNRAIGDVLIVAGDISHFNHQTYRLLKYFKENYYKYIVCVLGNHDYYIIGKEAIQNYPTSFDRVKEIRMRLNSIEGVHCLDGNCVEIEGVVFGGCDSWYNNGYMKYHYPYTSHALKSVNEMWRKLLNCPKYLVGVENYDDIWKIEEKKIEDVYKKCDVMVTHVNPCIKDEYIPLKYRKNQVNTFFTFSGEKYLHEGSMKYWVFGHTHDVVEFEEGEVKCLCNPVGYSHESGHMFFTEIRSFEIEGKR